MGCGALCVNNPTLSSQHKSNSVMLFNAALSYLRPCQPLLSSRQLRVFENEITLGSQRYHLVLCKGLHLKEEVPLGLQLKWRALIYGADRTNSAYCNCLGMKPWKESEKDNEVMEGNGENSKQIDPSYHSSFIQIEKDVNRTFEFTGGQKLEFTNVLKRIANHFPTMGYTQGVNFIVGYLVIMGFNEQHAFWIFIHLAVNRKYLLLGLFEEGLPLTNVYCLLFSNILKARDPQLHSHLYNDLQMDNSMWIFKWFITCYVYSFPIEAIKYIWDLFILVGSVGLVTFAVLLIQALKKPLLKIHDPCDISEFFKKLKDLTFFNQFVNLRHLMLKAYGFTLTQDDYAGVQNCGGAFYGQYTLQVIKGEHSEKLLSEWHEKLAGERKIFETGVGSTRLGDSKMPLNKKSEQCLKEINQSVISFTEELQQLMKSQRTIQRMPNGSNISLLNSCQINEPPPIDQSLKGSTLKAKKQLSNSKGGWKQIELLDELDKLALGKSTKVPSRIAILRDKPKASNLMMKKEVKETFTRAGKNVLDNLSDNQCESILFLSMNKSKELGEQVPQLPLLLEDIGKHLRSDKSVEAFSSERSSLDAANVSVNSCGIYRMHHEDRICDGGSQNQEKGIKTYLQKGDKLNIVSEIELFPQLFKKKKERKKVTQMILSVKKSENRGDWKTNPYEQEQSYESIMMPASSMALPRREQEV